MRDRRKLEPISIDELANDSTMTGFSDLFKIPTEAKTPATVVPGRWSQAKDIVSKSALLSRVAPRETIPPVTDGIASMPAVQQPESITPNGGSKEKSTARGFIEDQSKTSPAVSTESVVAGSETGPAVLDVSALQKPVEEIHLVNTTCPPVFVAVAAPSGSKEKSAARGFTEDQAKTSPAVSTASVVAGPETGLPVLAVSAFQKPVEEIHLVDTPYPPVITDGVAPNGIALSETMPPITGGPVSGWAVPPLPRKLQIREAKLVQEGHTYGEQTVYDALWKNANAVSESMRLITIGFLRMANLVGLAESNCKIAVAGLLDKLAVERLPDLNIAQGRTYKIYGWSAVLSRRRAAGLTHVVKSRGVVFVDPKTGLPLTSAKTLPRKKSGKSGFETSPPVSSSGIPTGNFQATIAELASRLRQNLDSSFDDSAAARLWRECQNSVPDCTIEEVIHFAALKAQKIYKDRNIRNPIGLLLMTVPEFFTGRALKEFRERNVREVEQQREFQTKQREYWKLVAQDPNTPLDERQLAAKFLTELFSE